MLALAVIVALMALAFLAWQIRENYKLRLRLANKPLVADLPSFINEDRCVMCTKPFERIGTEVSAEVRVGSKLLPVSMKICEECVRTA